MGYEGGVRTIGYLADLSKEKRYFPAGIKYTGLMHIADWMPTFLAIIDSGLNKEAVCKDPPAQEEPPLGYGYNQWCSIVNNIKGESPRDEVVVVLDTHTNFVSYIKKPYKMLLGNMGGGERNEGWDPQQRFIYANATVFQIVEEVLMEVVDYFSDTRDIAFFWHEVVVG